MPYLEAPMKGWQIEYRMDDIYNHINSMAESACLICKWKSEFKDPDDLEKAKCSRCKIFEMAEEIKDEVDRL